MSALKSNAILSVKLWAVISITFNPGTKCVALLDVNTSAGSWKFIMSSANGWFPRLCPFRNIVAWLSQCTCMLKDGFVNVGGSVKRRSEFMIRLFCSMAITGYGNIVSSGNNCIVGVGRLAVIIRMRRNNESIFIISSVEELHHRVKTSFGPLPLITDMQVLVSCAWAGPAKEFGSTNPKLRNITRLVINIFLFLIFEKPLCIGVSLSLDRELSVPRFFCH